MGLVTLEENNDVMTQRHRENHEKIEAEIGAGDTKDCWPSPEARKEAWNTLPLRTTRKNQPF